MKNKRKKTIIVATSIMVVLISSGLTSLITQQTAATVVQHNEKTEKIVIQIIDESKTKDIVVTLTQQKASDVEKVIEITSEKLQRATTPGDLREVYAEALSSLRSLGLFKTDVEWDMILHVLKTAALRYSSLQGRRQSLGIFHWNALCCIAGDTTNTQLIGIRTITLDYLLSALQRLGLTGSYIVPLLTISWFLDAIKPFSVWNRILLGQYHIPGGMYPAEGWIVTCGLTGPRIWKGSMRGNILGGSYYSSTGAIGFTGIKILHDDFSKNFYFGTALLVSIDQ
jgi:hypothetical protein